MAPLLVLPPEEAHLWYLRTDEVGPGVDAVARSWMSADERERHARFKVARARRVHLAARTLVRWALSRYASVGPEAWSFRRGAWGRPEIAGPEAVPLRFNLSHTAELVVCLVAAAIDVGVDAEALDARVPLDGAGAGGVLAPAELVALHALPAADRPRRFLEYWTLKEAYAKARGRGAWLPFDRMAFTLAPPRPPTVALGDALRDDPDDWQFVQLTLVEHLVAAALRRGGAADRRVVVCHAEL